MKNNFIYIVLFLVMSCSQGQGELISTCQIGKTKNDQGVVYYKLWKIGIDNYKYTFYLKKPEYVVTIQEAFLNDANPENVEIGFLDNNDTLIITSNYVMDVKEPIRTVKNYVVEFRF